MVGEEAVLFLRRSSVSVARKRRGLRFVVPLIISIGFISLGTLGLVVMLEPVWSGKPVEYEINGAPVIVYPEDISPLYLALGLVSIFIIIGVALLIWAVRPFLRRGNIDQGTFLGTTDRLIHIGDEWATSYSWREFTGNVTVAGDGGLVLERKSIGVTHYKNSPPRVYQQTVEINGVEDPDALRDNIMEAISSMKPLESRTPEAPEKQIVVDSVLRMSRGRSLLLIGFGVMCIFLSWLLLSMAMGWGMFSSPVPVSSSGPLELVWLFAIVFLPVGAFSIFIGVSSRAPKRVRFVITPSWLEINSPELLVVPWGKFQNVTAVSPGQGSGAITLVPREEWPPNLSNVWADMKLSALAGFKPGMPIEINNVSDLGKVERAIRKGLDEAYSSM